MMFFIREAKGCQAQERLKTKLIMLQLWISFHQRRFGRTILGSQEILFHYVFPVFPILLSPTHIQNPCKVVSPYTKSYSKKAFLGNSHMPMWPLSGLTGSFKSIPLLVWALAINSGCNEKTSLNSINLKLASSYPLFSFSCFSRHLK